MIIFSNNYTVITRLKEGQSFKLFNIDYTVEKVLDEGGFGEVSLIKRDDILYAMKSIIQNSNHYHFTVSSEYKALMNEFKTCITLPPHNNIVNFISFHKDKSENIYAILEYVADGNLSDLIGKDGISDMKLILDISIDIASGLSYLHSNDIVHRDLNPRNIMLTKYPLNGLVTYLAKITDFGLSTAKLTNKSPNTASDGDNKISEVSDFIGNQAYVSPEQINKLSSGEEKDTDIFAFGMTLCEIITGSLPFRDNDSNHHNDFYAAKQDLEDKIVLFIQSSNKKIDTRIINLIVKCLHYRPEFRWKEEKDNGNFRYFETIREELLQIRSSLFGTIREIKLELEGEYELYQMKGAALLNLEDYTSAKDMLIKSLEINPQNINSMCNLALAYEGLEEYDSALLLLDKALDYDSKDAEIYVYIGHVFSKKKYPLDYVLDCFNKALQIEPKNYYACYNIGYQLYHSEDNCKEARTFFERAYELNQQDPTLNFYLGVCDLGQNNIDRCERYFNESIRTSGFSAEFYIRIIEKLIEYEKWTLARKYCQEGRMPQLHFSNQKL